MTNERHFTFIAGLIKMSETTHLGVASKLGLICVYSSLAACST